MEFGDWTKVHRMLCQKQNFCFNGQSPFQILTQIQTEWNIKNLDKQQFEWKDEII